MKMVKITVDISAKASKMIDLLLEEGTFGNSREDIAHRLIDQQLNALHQANPLYRK